jgi:hypothetical protein
LAKKYEGELSDFSGGINDFYDPSVIGPRFSSRLDNFVIRGPHAITRNGITKVTVVALPDRVTGLFAYGETIGQWRIIAGTRATLYKIAGGFHTQLVNRDGVAIPLSDDVWRMVQYKNTGYAVRGGMSALVRFDDNGFSLAGISAPPSAVTVASSGGGGVMEAGVRHVVMTFVNLDTEVESNPSPNSAAVTTVANDTILVTNAAVPTNPQVNGRRFYVELPGIAGQYYLALETSDITGTSFTLNKAIESLGKLASFRNSPPIAIEYVDLAIWKERLWLSDGRDVFFSENVGGVGLAECFASTNLIEVYPDDRNRISALVPFGERLVVAKSNGVHAIVTSGDSWDLQTLSDRQGCPAGGSMRAAEGYLWWFSGENFYETNGASLVTISDPPVLSPYAPTMGYSRIRAFIDSIPNNLKKNVQAAVYPKLGWYVASAPTGNATTPTKSMVYDYRNRRWFGPFYHATYGAPTVFGDFLDENELPRVYCAFYGSNHVYDFIGSDIATIQQDDGTPITCVWRSGGLNMGAPNYEHVLQAVSLMLNPINEVATVRAYLDSIATPVVEAVGVPLRGPRQMQRITLPAQRAYHTQVELEYAGPSRLLLKGFYPEADVFGMKENPV